MPAISLNLNSVIPIPAAPVSSIALSSQPGSQPKVSLMQSNLVVPMATTRNRKDVTIYKGVSDRPLGWKSKRISRYPFEHAINSAGLRRWDGRAKTSTSWDNLEKDDELWFQDGDCYVHLYARGRSRRGPSFKLHYDKLVDSQCSAIIDRYLDLQINESTDAESSEEEAHIGHQSRIERYDLYIPAPTAKNRNDAILFHLTTRNLFAFIYGKPLVGPCLGTTLVRLLTRMKEVRPADNTKHALEYMRSQGYLDLRSQRNHSLAVLNFAEHFQLKKIWIAAFSHCVGMDGKLSSSPEYEYISRESRTLISQARFEMDIRLDRCGTKLKTFLEDDLAHIPILSSPAAKTHLDRFRAFLLHYYSQKLGSYPPASERFGSAFPKHVTKMMCEDFQNLRDFLADETTAVSNGGITGTKGLPVVEAIQAFDRRNRHEPLQYSQPLLPQLEDGQTRKSPFRKLGLRQKSRRHSQASQRLLTISALIKATNRQKPDLLRASLVQEYCRFESDCVFIANTETQQKLSVVDARKVRWVLVYAMLQTLLSITAVPPEVQDSQDVPYNLCVITAGCLPWKEIKNIETASVSRTASFRSSLVFDCPDETINSRHSTPESLSTDMDSSSLDHQNSNSISELIPRKSSSSTQSSSTSSSVSPMSSIRRTLSGRIGQQTEFKQPQTQRASYHELMVQNYNSGRNKDLKRAESLGSSSSTPLSLVPEVLEIKISPSLSHAAIDEAFVDFTSRWSSTDDDTEARSSGEVDDTDTMSSDTGDYLSCRGDSVRSSMSSSRNGSFVRKVSPLSL